LKANWYQTHGIDSARAALLRAKTDFYQTLFDKEVSIAYLAKVTGEVEYNREVEK